MVDPQFVDRARGCALGAAIGDALGMPLEFGPRRSAGNLLREMVSKRLPAGAFTDDTEMALAVAESLLAIQPLDQADLAGRFLGWFRFGPADVGVQTSSVLWRVGRGETWQQAVREVQLRSPESAGNGSLMRCWPVALAHHDDLPLLTDTSVRQSQVTHWHGDCGAACALVNTSIALMLHGRPPADAIAQALDQIEMLPALRKIVEEAPGRTRDELANSGWVRHTLESAIWGLLTTSSFEEAVIQVVNLGNDADTAGTVAGALAGATYGLQAIPMRWQQALHGEWPLKSGVRRTATDFLDLADRLIGAAR